MIALGLEGEELLEQGGKDGGLGLAVAQRQPQRFQSRRPESEQQNMRLLRPVRSGQRIVSVRPVRRGQSGNKVSEASVAGPDKLVRPVTSEASH